MGMRSIFGSVALAATAGAGLVAGTMPSSSAEASADPQGSVALVQAVPGVTMSVAVDGREVQRDVTEGDVVGPLDLSQGKHEVVFTPDEAQALLAGGDGASPVSATLEVKAGENSDVVIHDPADVGGAPVVSVYRTPMAPIGPGKARVLLAHTATTAPADVKVDGTTVFTNIANGEFAQADVAAGGHQVTLLPSGVMASPILGPLPIALKTGTVTSVYAVGNPQMGSMKVIVHAISLGDDGSVAPKRIETGSAGLASDIHVYTFSGRR